MNKHRIGLIGLALVVSTLSYGGEVSDLFDIASEGGKAEGVVTGRFAQRIRDYTQAVGDIHATVTTAGTQAGCRVFNLRLKMTVKTQQGGLVPYEQPILVPVCANGLPPPGFLPPDMHQRLVENFAQTKE
jgi:hypothetical protein